METGAIIEGRDRLHGMWAAVAGAWGEHAEYADTRGAEITERMLDLTAPGPGDRVLELACGAEASGWPRPRGSRRAARWSSPTSSRR